MRHIAGGVIAVILAAGAVDQQRIHTDGTSLSCADGKVLKWAAGAIACGDDEVGAGGGSGGAPTDATYVTQTADGTLSAEQALSALSTGLLKVTGGTGVLSTAVAGDFPTLNQSTTGNAATATALAANPADCGANTYATGIAASGALTCGSIVDADVPNTITVNLAAAATALAANPTDCGGGQFANAIDASGNLTCGTPAGGGGGGDTYVSLGADVTNSNASFANVTGLSWAVSASTGYDIECHVSYTAAATTTGLGISWTGPSSPTLTTARMLSGLTSQTVGGTTVQGNDTGSTTTGSVAASPTLNHADFHGTWKNGANAGTLQIRFKSEVAASAIVVKAGSWCKYSVF